ncbi:MAG: globin-coupled sensor protein [Limnochordaceae bacterium]|nr:globin-coupled sensor protein [Limnochordaceae bacterium]
MSPYELEAVRAMGRQLHHELDAITDRFYDRVTAVQELRAIIDRTTTVDALRRTFRQYVRELLEGRPDDAYVLRRQHIGRAHVRVALRPAWYLAAYAVLWDELWQAAARSARPRRRGLRSWWGQRRAEAGPGVPEAAWTGLVKLMLLDALLAVETYLEGDRSEHLSRQALGHHAELTELSRQLSGVSQHMAALSEESAAAIEHVAAAASGLDEQASSMTASVQQVTVDTSRGAELVRSSAEEASEARHTSERTYAQVEQLVDRTKGLQRIARTIEEVAEQTNLLALNAAIEAARAGEQGKSFAVVAEEVRRLATRTGVLVRDVQQELQAITRSGHEALEAAGAGRSHAQSAASSSQEAGEALVRIGAAMQALARSTEAVGLAAAELHKGIEEIRASSVELASRATAVAELAGRLIRSERSGSNAAQFDASHTERAGPS